MKKSNKNANFITIILLMSSIVLLVLSIFLRHFVLNKNTYLELLDKSNTYVKIEDTLYKKMDSLLGSDVSEEIKKSIITDEDVRREADNVITCIIDDLKTGQINPIVINTDVYKQRVSNVLESFTGYKTQSTNNLSFNDDVQSEKVIVENTALIQNEKIKVQNMALNQNQIEVNNTLLVDNTSQARKNSYTCENLASRAELEARGRAMLREKGLTEAQARQKLAEKGMTEEDVWNMLKESGELDEEKSDSTSSKKDESHSSSNKETNSINDQNSSAEITTDEKNIDEPKNNTANDKGILSKSKIKRIISSIISDKGRTMEEKLNDISNELSQEAGIAIDNEIEKLNLDKLINSNKFKNLAKVTAFFNRMNVVFMIFPIIFIAMLIEINRKNFKATLKSIGSAFFVTGVILLLILFGAYMSKFYNSINIAPIYINDMLLLTVKHFFKVLLISEIVIVVIGIILLIPAIKGSIAKKISV